MLRRPRPTVSRRLARHRTSLETEGLESRRLLVATPIDVASGVTFALGLPLPGLATGTSPTPTAPSLATVTATVAPAPAPTGPPVGPSPTGPATTLSPLMNDAETAVATASEVARPTPGRSDRISTVVSTPDLVPIPHLRLFATSPMIPGPEIQVRPQAPAAPAPPPAQLPVEPPAAVPVRPVAPLVVPSEVAQSSLDLATWDAALDMVATERPEDAPVSLVDRTESAVAAGALLAAWGGWKYGRRSEGRSRRRPLGIGLPESPGGPLP